MWKRVEGKKWNRGRIRGEGRRREREGEDDGRKDAGSGRKVERRRLETWKGLVERR